ncbi:hypothetical protein [Leeuwenhoekiella nanhaiensis]|nr:hypothetical protein [Leeuwenhoekiella nanhaiensis]
MKLAACSVPVKFGVAAQCLPQVVSRSLNNYRRLPLKNWKQAGPDAAIYQTTAASGRRKNSVNRGLKIYGILQVAAGV